jgi:sialate O-acetylesterase
LVADSSAFRTLFPLVVLMSVMIGTADRARAADGDEAVAGDAPLAHSVFQSRAVLQRDTPIVVWGNAAPAENVSVSIAGAVQTVRADAAGRWAATLPAMAAGGPYSVNVQGSSGASQKMDDVLIGDVWLCSGQSNMVLPVHRALDSRSEIAASSNDSIRMLTVPQSSALQPRGDFAASVQWQKASPATVPEFSAACLYFARELQKSVKVPMGLIAAAWGGSKIESWMSRDALSAVRAYDTGLEILALYAEDPLLAYARWGSVWESWWRERYGADSQPWSENASGEWRTAPRGLGRWESWGVPELAAYNGMLWYRTRVTLSTDQAAQAATLSLGIVDEVDQTWINGKPIGAGKRRAAGRRNDALTGPGPERTYRLPAGSLRSGENVIVINVLDTYASGGLQGPPENRWLRFADGQALPLDGEWRYQIPASAAGAAPRAPWEPVAGLGVIHNGMIAPLGNLKLRGVAWYQGESNADEPSRYQDLLIRYMADGRKRFGADLPFLIVQLANYGPPPTAPAQSGWAELREAQRLAVSRDPRAGLVVAIDLGERYDIHPANKQDVGRRLARAARRVVYGESIAPSGPRPLAARREGSAVVVAFADVDKRLIAYGAEGPIGFELCGAAAPCRYARAEIKGDQVWLTAEISAPDTVRYCWADSPVCTLYDGAHLPAGPFEIKVQ